MPVPEWLASRYPDYDCLADLDASVWTKVRSSAEIGLLADTVSTAISRSVDAILAELGGTRIWRSERPPVQLLRIGSTTALALQDASRDDRPWYELELAPILSASQECAAEVALDLLCSLESWGLGADRRASALRAAQTAASLSLRAIGDSQLTVGDPRLGSLLGDVLAFRPVGYRRQPAVVFIAEVAYRGHRLEMNPLELAALAEGIGALTAALVTASNQTFSEETASIIGAVAKHERDAWALCSRYGLYDGRPKKLREIAEVEDVSMQCARNWCVRLERRISESASGCFAPKLDQFLDFVAHALPARADSRGLPLGDEGERAPTHLLKMAPQWAELLGRVPTYESVTVGRAVLLIAPGDETPSADTVDELEEAAIRACRKVGATTVSALARTLFEQNPELSESDLADLVDLADELEWLDRDAGWLWSRSTSVEKGSGRRIPNRTLRIAAKALCVCHRLDIDSLRAAIRRARRQKGPVPPRDVLFEMFRRSEGFATDANTVSRIVDDDYRRVLRGAELEVADLLLSMGGVGRSEELWQLAQPTTGRVAFWTALSTSPVVVRLARSTYALRGMELSASEVWETANKRVLRSNSVLRDSGHFGDRQAWAVYRLSDSTARGGPLAVPRELQIVADGQYFILDEAASPSGTLTIEGTHMWGLRGFLGSHSAEAGDRLLVALDLDRRVAAAALGDEEFEYVDDATLGLLFDMTSAHVPVSPNVSLSIADLERSEDEQLALGPGQDMPELDHEVESEIGDPTGAAKRILAAQVIAVLEAAARPLKAKEIARQVSARTSVSAGTVDRSEVNHLLYGVLRPQILDCGAGQWELRRR